MGRVFLEHFGGTHLFLCANCNAFLTNKAQLVSTRFTGATGRAFLFNKAVNLIYSEIQHRMMITGLHFVRDVSCKRCQKKLGWVYEFAVEETQIYKEGHVILEQAHIVESVGLDETPSPSRDFHQRSPEVERLGTDEVIGNHLNILFDS